MKNSMRVTLLVCVALLQAVVTAPAQNAEAASPPRLPAAEAEIRPGDQISVRIFREPELSGVFTVSEAGEVVLPRLGRTVVTGVGAAALQESLREAYSAYLRNPSIEVTVLRRIAVLGEVRRPDLYMVDLTTTVRDLLARAGGTTEMGDANAIVLVRGGEQIRLGKAATATTLTADLQSGDQIVVGRRSWVSVNALGIISTAAVAVTVFVPLIRSLTGL